MKENETVTYRDLGTIRMIKDEGRRWYISTHKFFNQPDEATSLKEARENLLYQEERRKEIEAAIHLLQRHKYRIFKEIG